MRHISQEKGAHWFAQGMVKLSMPAATSMLLGLETTGIFTIGNISCIPSQLAGQGWGETAKNERHASM